MRLRAGSRLRWRIGQASRSVPVIVTRTSGEGISGTYWMPAWMVSVGMLLVWLNVVAWSLLGFVEVVRIAGVL